jgi:GT2 family glycosyltransferase
LNDRIEIIDNPDNTGVSWPSNMAFEKVETELILHMNPDVRFDDACVERLVRTMDSNPNAAVISPMIINANGDQEIDVLGPGEIEHRKIAVPPEGPFCSWYVCGSVWLWRTAALRKLEGFDSNIFLYNEDVDICLRASKAGYSLIVDTEAVIHHGGGASERISRRTRWRKDWNLTWSHYYLKSKHLGHSVAVREARSQRWKFLGNAIAGLFLLRPKTVIGQLARFRAANHFLKGGPSWLRTNWVRPRPY